MKNIILILSLLFLGGALQGQELILDTIYFQYDTTQGAWFEVFDQQYDNGAQNFTKKQIGDTTAVLQYMVATVLNSNQQLGGNAINVIRNKGVFKARNDAYEAAYEGITGGNWDADVVDVYQAEILGNYRLFIEGASQGDFELVEVGNGTLRLRLISNPATLYVTKVLSQNSMRINGLPTVGNTEIYLVGTNNVGRPLYFSLDRSVRLVRLPD